MEIGDSETCEAGFGLSASACGAFVTDLAACAGGGSGPGSDGGGMVVGFYLAKDVDWF